MKPNSSTRLKSINKVAQRKQASETYSKNDVAIILLNSAYGFQFAAAKLLQCLYNTTLLMFFDHEAPGIRLRRKYWRSILIVILNDKVSSYDELVLQITDCSLSNKRIHNNLLSSNAFILIGIHSISRICSLCWLFHEKNWNPYFLV